MIITKQFIMDMGVCGESLVWYESIFGTGPHPYFHVYDMVANTSDIDEETRERWIKWSESLQTNVDAIKYDGQYTLGRFKVTGVGISEYFTSFEDAKAAYDTAWETRYTGNSLFDISCVVRGDNESLTFMPCTEDMLPDAEYSVKAPHVGQPDIVLGNQVDALIASRLAELAEIELGTWEIVQEVIDPDNFIALEKVTF